MKHRHIPTVIPKVPLPSDTRDRIGFIQHGPHRMSSRQKHNTWIDQTNLCFFKGDDIERKAKEKTLKKTNISQGELSAMQDTEPTCFIHRQTFFQKRTAPLEKGTGHVCI
mmetsp:Transcript_29409/g.49469  ORF Transcript_29409/g.49469 Transcript_29409/m.49469 type:complete len:110 (-) Transcript_29409:105-434(-)